MRFLEWIREILGVRDKTIAIHSLNRIVKYTIPQHDPKYMKRVEAFQISKKANKVVFAIHEVYLEDLPKFKTMTVKDSFMNWKAVSIELSEYNEVYDSDYNNYLKNLLSIVKIVIKDDNYSHIIARYESSLLALANIVELSIKDDKPITKEMKDNIEKCIRYFGTKIYEKRDELKDLERKIREAENQSYLDMIKNEVEFIEEFIEK